MSFCNSFDDSHNEYISLRMGFFFSLMTCAVQLVRFRLSASIEIFDVERFRFHSSFLSPLLWYRFDFEGTRRISIVKSVAGRTFARIKSNLRVIFNLFESFLVISCIVCNYWYSSRVPLMLLHMHPFSLFFWLSLLAF